MAALFVEIHPTLEQLVAALPFIDRENFGPDSSPANQCPICMKCFKNRGSKGFHMRKTHNAQAEQTLESSLGLSSGYSEAGLMRRFFCPFEKCPATRNNKHYFNSTKLLIQHFQKAHFEKRHKCTDCTAKFALERDLRYHRKKVCPNRSKCVEIIEEVPRPCSVPPLLKTQKSSRAVQTEGTGTWLVPTKFRVIGKFKKIQARKPQKSSISTQTDPSAEEQLFIGQSDIEQTAAAMCYNNNHYCTSQTMDQMVQMDMPMDTSAYQQYQHSYAQTIYPQTIDFGTQYPIVANGTATTNYTSSAPIYLSSHDFQASAATQHQLPPPTLLGTVFDESEEARMSHCETQTPMASDGFPNWGSMDMAAQTDLSSFDDFEL